MADNRSEHCQGICETCETPEACTDHNVCKSHSGNTTQLKMLSERVGDLEERDSVVDNLTGRVNMLINICLLVITTVIGDFGYTITMNKKLEDQYAADRLALEKQLASDKLEYTTALFNLSTALSEKIDEINNKLSNKLNDMNTANDKRFDQIERELPIIQKEIINIHTSHLKEMERLEGKTTPRKK